MFEPIIGQAEQEATDSSTEYQAKGYELHSEEFLTCPSCNKNLVSLLIVKKDCAVMENYRSVAFRAKCPKCKVDSFRKIMSDVKLYWQSVLPFVMVDIDIDYNQLPPLVKIILK